MRAFFAKNTSNSDCYSDAFLQVNNCGCYHEIDAELTVRRPQGRLDYQLIYIAEGEGTFTLSGKKMRVGKGRCVLFRPHVPQIYSFGGGGESFYWIHFTGTGVAKALLDLHLEAEVFEPNGFEIEQLFESIVDRYRLGDTAEQNLFAAGGIMMLLSMLTKGKSAAKKNRLETIIAHMREDGGRGSIGTYAALCAMSEYHFIRAFKETFGQSPRAYQINLTMENCKRLLIDSDLPVGKIASLSGYDDPFYFSRFFKKHCGVSPAGFRKMGR